MTGPYRSGSQEFGEEPWQSFTWPRQLLGRVLVTLGMSRYRAGDTKGILHREAAPTFGNLREALASLQRARDTWLFLGHDCTGLYVLDRVTGRRYSPSPELIDDLLHNRCAICRAEGDEPCDVGYHG
jgi:hypothetical protein